MTIDPVVSLLVGALGATVVGGIGAFVGSWIQARRERARWVREMRANSYQRMLRLVARLRTFHGWMFDEEERLASNPNYFVEWEADYADTVSELQFVGPRIMFAAGNVLMTTSRAWWEASENLGSATYVELRRQYERARAVFAFLAQRTLKIGSEQLPPDCHEMHELVLRRYHDLSGRDEK
jgi:hypothetical protein